MLQSLYSNVDLDVKSSIVFHHLRPISQSAGRSAFGHLFWDGESMEQEGNRKVDLAKILFGGATNLFHTDPMGRCIYFQRAFYNLTL
jgi:mevalonate pyrophosphate decarboxylase